MLWPQPYEWFVARLSGLLARADGAVRAAGPGNFGGLRFGIDARRAVDALAGPVLGSILTLIAISENLARAGLLLVGLRDRRGNPDIADRLWWAVRHHPDAQACALHACPAANLWCGRAARRGPLSIRNTTPSSPCGLRISIPVTKQD